MAVVTTIPKEKAKAFTHKLSKALSGEHDLAKVDMVDRLNRQLRGLGGVLQIHGLHRDHVPTHRSCCVLENGALVGEEVPESHQTTDAELVPTTSRWASQDLVCPRGQ
jgi:hypothetical protein